MRIYEAWCTYQEGTKHELKTSFGPIKVRVRYTPGQRVSRICIIRAGMFITDDDSLLPRRHFSSKQTFSAVLLFADNRDHPTEADNILRVSEDAGHSRIKSTIREGLGQCIPQLFEEIREELKRILDDASTSGTHIPDLLPIVIPHTQNKAPHSQRVKPKRKNSNSYQQDDEGNKRYPGRRRRKGKKSTQKGLRPFRPRTPVPISVVRLRPNRYEIEIAVPAEAKPRPNVFLRLETKTGSDDTCELPLPSQSVVIDVAQSRQNGSLLPTAAGSDIALGTLEPNRRIRLSLVLKGNDTMLPLQAVLYEGE